MNEGFKLENTSTQLPPELTNTTRADDRQQYGTSNLKKENTITMTDNITRATRGIPQRGSKSASSFTL
jgi:hypothetical protein